MDAIIAAFFNSLRGLSHAARTEGAVQRELAMLAISLPAAYFLAPELWVGVALIGSILLVLAVELLNTGLEELCDHVTPENHPAIGTIKDMGSGAVFCTLVLAGLVWGAALIEAWRSVE